PGGNKEFGDDLVEKVDQTITNRGYLSAINGVAEFLINKDLGSYQPNLILSKNLMYRGAQVAFINHYRYKNLTGSLGGRYHSDGLLSLNAQIMLKSPNVEFFMGSNDLLKSMEHSRQFNEGTVPYEAGS